MTYKNNETIVSFNATDATFARYKTSTYGRYGGGQRLVADLIAGTVQPNSVPDGKGKKRQVNIHCSYDDRTAITEMAKAAGYESRSQWIADQLFVEEKTSAASHSTSSIGDWAEDDDRDVYAHAAYSMQFARTAAGLPARGAQDDGITRSTLAAFATGAGRAAVTRRGPIALNLAPDTRSTLEAAAVNAGVNLETLIARRLDELARVLREAGC